jgi:hypothetical protein
MVYFFKPKIPIWVNFGGPRHGKRWYILWPFGNLAAIWYIFPRFGILCQEKSGDPAHRATTKTSELRPEVLQSRD